MTSAVTPTAHVAPKDRAPGPGPSAARRGVFWGLAAVLVVTLSWGIHGLLSRPAAPGLRVESPQRWLPRSLTAPVDQVLVGTVARPALTIQGDAVEVRTPTFSALAVVSGPVVPGEGLPVQQRHTTCTWTVSFTHVDGTLPLSVSDFDSIDHHQTVYQPALVPGQFLPAALHTGQTLTFRVRSVMPVGEGLFRWAPDGDHVVAKWDYQVEND